MYCLKCGREVNEDRNFCPDCVSVMEKYPVKPGTAVLLPKRREGSPISRSPVRRKTLTAEEQIRKLRRNALTFFVMWVITFLLLCAVTALGISHVLQQQHFSLGQNYSVITHNETENK